MTTHRQPLAKSGNLAIEAMEEDAAKHEQTIKHIAEAIASYQRVLNTGLASDGQLVPQTERSWIARQIIILQGKMATVLGAMSW